MASEKMRVLPGTEKEIRKKRAVLRPPAKDETIMMRGTNASAPDLVCGSCGAVLAVGMSSHNLRMAIACNRCDAVNETIGKNETIAKQDRQSPPDATSEPDAAPKPSFKLFIGFIRKLLPFR